ncbi:MAG: hypothetical protein IKV35_03670, partial [Clostridia bacterium]|nr:hypothetical protein [Clostridia bacterium]
LLAVAAVIFLVGLVLTIKGGDWFVDSASWFAEATGIPKFVVGATVVSFATTLPELLVSVSAATNGSAQLAIGNAVGSVTANTTLIMGVSLAAMAGVVSRKEFSLKGGLFLAAVVGLTVLSLSNALPVWSAYVLWAIFLIFMISNIIEGKKSAYLKNRIRLKRRTFLVRSSSLFWARLRSLSVRNSWFPPVRRLLPASASAKPSSALRSSRSVRRSPSSSQRLPRSVRRKIRFLSVTSSVRTSSIRHSFCRCVR